MVLYGSWAGGSGHGECWRDQYEQKSLEGIHAQGERSSSACLPITQGSEYFCLSNFMQLIYPQPVPSKLPALAQ